MIRGGDKQLQTIIVQKCQVSGQVGACQQQQQQKKNKLILCSSFQPV